MDLTLKEILDLSLINRKDQYKFISLDITSIKYIVCNIFVVSLTIYLSEI